MSRTFVTVADIELLDKVLDFLREEDELTPTRLCGLLLDSTGEEHNPVALAKSLSRAGLKTKGGQSRRYFLAAAEKARFGRSPEVVAVQAARPERKPGRRHGLSTREWEERFLAQGGSCNICGRENPGAQGWATDHDHRHCPGNQGCAICVRGILCASCNTGIGFLGDSPATLRKAADYLERSQEDVYKRMLESAAQYREAWTGAAA